ncbi:glycine betaine/carnitine/choline transport system permease protein OpuCD [Oceanobacillus oncorhynchi subsp. incaldanensis]|uniref:Glycine betaine/carnitine/choline transport system permease protein OpuCD n=1 Tax=Oceanobacillus oncorhynchi TaxID=545501 RepID=A0A0A1MXQ0_9BACI|nr:ABC transporter permease [Oceanobacillus oncorhynchi]UUI42063.1 ABC transporter permease [Oceanobacillus oncorhynchi]GIO17370.1 glycine betaine/carnitine/choline transport system permease protein OpuCD [Oceanobacillus oncorhynchi subsp. incaldanensis]CEI83586.1 Glycine betaine/carnitine/choline transport system permease protein OpuCD [Oceanobacillus oncorhynchi]
MSVWEQLITYVSQNGSYIWTEFYRHFLMAAYGVLFASIVSIPIGVLIARYGKLSGWVLTLGSIIQTIPVLGFMAITMVAMGLGTTTVVTTVFFYSLLPIIQNTYVGITGVDQTVKEAAYASGMTRFQLLMKVELPLAISVMMAGIRTALVVGIGVVAIGTFVGAGGLGAIIVRGTNATDGTAIILAGAVPTALMAIAADLIMGKIERMLNPVK